MANVQDRNRLPVDCEQDAVAVLPAAVEQLPHLKREGRISRGEWTPCREVGERCYGLTETLKPAQAGSRTRKGIRQPQRGRGSSGKREVLDRLGL
jgi:hypothetical protein